MKFKIYKFKSVTSTNDEAMILIKKKQKKTGCVYADSQTKGRGTYGKKWVSNKGNLFSSIFFPLKNNYPPFNEFSIINPIIIADVMMKFCEEKYINFKFPNDIFLNGKKICGLLQEHIQNKNKKFLIIGIGLNVITNPQLNNNYKATNLFQETKKKPSVEEIIKLITHAYENFFSKLSLYDYNYFKKKAEKMSFN
jgi:BirA family transcriptional regulator, biotin operon repressor / biotin---[acetyl-CoA-carboxylase] ligase